MTTLAGRLALAMFGLVPAAGLHAQPPRQMLQGLEGDFYAPLRTMRDLKFASVVRQRYDFSCGSAALASLLRYHYSIPVDEARVFQGMWKSGDRPQIQKLGFSLLDMKRYLAAQGLAANGFKVSLADIAAKRIPGIALIDVKGYKHFVVVKGIERGEVLIGDPARGLIAEPVSQFQASWNGVYFVIDPDARAGAFDSGVQWASVARAPYGNGFSDPLSSQALSLAKPFFGDF